ncbi:hypothetical protein AYI68_g5603 [Smittium mucronatum]|uniref:Uncharacterized protein n=1 Tax=Smittium mucronatum TaxID=133383 RepID=A0A1R0GTU9_9FUNG|nr:hypothetical protein AYI68_g5603 [Smittium mucronatum]
MSIFLGKEKAEDPYVTASISVTNLTVYPKLTNAHPSIEEDFFGSPLTEEERKIAIHSCPRTSSMKYVPSSMKYTVSSTVKKTDSDFYEIQLSLDQETRPSVNTTMRALLTEISTTVTQKALYNFHRELVLTGNPTQPIKSEKRSLMDQEVLNDIIAKKPSASAPWPYYETYGPTSEVSPASLQNKAESGDKKGSSKRSRFLSIEESYQKDKMKRPWTLWSVFYDPEKYERSRDSIRPPQAQYSCRKAELQYGESFFNLQNDNLKGLPDLFKTTRWINAYSSLQENPKISQVSLERSLLPVFLSPIRTILIPFVFTKILRPVFECAKSNNMRFSACKNDLLIMGAPKVYPKF